MTRLGDPDGLLEAECDEAGEKEGAEGVDVEGDDVLGYLGRGGAVQVVDEAVVRVGRVPSQPDEDSQREEGVDVDDAVERRYVDAGAEPGRSGDAVHFNGR